ncbi:MAG: RNA-binding S4 domain-containing protein [Oscillospiraceae bacterium]|nr:RNA-binding S4 domain-containing protein [Oscillospiraceae bacterium]MDD3832725.1 RNA-binding S4 domain-containing protein [Oscillospiraceae bacterium]MDD4546217.1 RNA-binding S4 domain-containing protein [Oscillospiraceae bacterium]
MKTEIKDISTDYIKLDTFLKLVGAVSTGGQAKEWVKSGKITVNGEVCIQRGRKLHTGDTVKIAGGETDYTVGKQKE